MKYNSDIQQQIKKIEQERLALSTLVGKTQLVCDHPKQAESRLSAGEARLCLCCGLSELSLGCGYQILDDEFKVEISSLEYHKYAKGFTVGDGEKTVLIRTPTNERVSVLRKLIRDRYKSYYGEDL